MRTRRNFTKPALLAGAVLLLVPACDGADPVAESEWNLALPAYRNAQRKAREFVLRENLFVMRQAIDQFVANEGHYPLNIEALVAEDYLRRLPEDPILGERRWDVMIAPADASLDAAQPPGVYGVKSLASGETLDGVPYGEL